MVGVLWGSSPGKDCLATREGRLQATLSGPLPHRQKATTVRSHGPQGSAHGAEEDYGDIRTKSVHGGAPGEAGSSSVVPNPAPLRAQSPGLFSPDFRPHLPSRAKVLRPLWSSSQSPVMLAPPPALPHPVQSSPRPWWVWPAAFQSCLGASARVRVQNLSHPEHRASRGARSAPGREALPCSPLKPREHFRPHQGEGGSVWGAVVPQGGGEDGEVMGWRPLPRHWLQPAEVESRRGQAERVLGVPLRPQQAAQEEGLPGDSPGGAGDSQGEWAGQEGGGQRSRPEQRRGNPARQLRARSRRAGPQAWGGDGKPQGSQV